MKNFIKDLIKSLEEDCKEIDEMILLRIEEKSTSENLENNLEDPRYLNVILEDSESEVNHAYDIGRVEAFEEIIATLKIMLNEKN
jgi:hypothetical protein